jgi:U4/U6 small nuclear ribonucleoprotein PRP4
VSQVRFEPADGLYLLTSGFDNVSKLWCGRNFQLVRTLAGHEGKVMCSDICPDGSHLVATAGYDRTIKLYAPDPLAAAAES